MCFLDVACSTLWSVNMQDIMRLNDNGLNSVCKCTITSLMVMLQNCTNLGIFHRIFKRDLQEKKGNENFQSIKSSYSKESLVCIRNIKYVYLLWDKVWSLTLCLVDIYYFCVKKRVYFESLKFIQNFCWVTQPTSMWRKSLYWSN